MGTKPLDSQAFFYLSYILICVVSFALLRYLTLSMVTLHFLKLIESLRVGEAHNGLSFEES